MDEKLLLIGFDGISWEYLNYLLERGHLKNFMKLKEISSFGSLKSTYPPGTYIAWPSFMTGVGPEKHSIFYPIVFQKKWSYEGASCNSSMIKYPTLYEIFSTHGFSIGVVDHPAAYPPLEVNGFFVSKYPLISSDFTYPANIKKILLDKFPEYDMKLERTSDPREAIKSAMSIMDVRKEASFHLFSKYDPDVKSITFNVTDSISHWYWDQAEFIDHIYLHCDTILGEYLEKYSDSHNIVVFSDHGFSRCVSYFYPNAWLEQQGYLVWKQARTDYFAKLKKSGRTTLKRLLKAIHLYNKYVQSQEYDSKPAPISGLSNVINWNKTKVYFREDMGFRFNILGREAQGIITEEEALHIYRDLRLKIQDLADPHHFDSPPFSDFIKRIDLYDGPCMLNSPDFFIETRHNYARAFSSGKSTELFQLNKLAPGKHDNNGIFFMTGKNIEKGNLIPGMSLVDLLPNLCFLMDVSGFDYFDGTVRKELFNSSYLSTHKYRTSHRDEPFERESVELQDEEKKEIEDFWKKVGYL